MPNKNSNYKKKQNLKKNSIIIKIIINQNLRGLLIKEF